MRGPYKQRGPYRCNQCGASYYTRRPPGEGELYCSRECSFKAKAAAPKFSKLHLNHCNHCGREWLARRHSGSCSAECRKAVARTNSKEWSKGRKQLEQRICKHCGTTFRALYGDKHRTFCTKDCSDRSHDAKRLWLLKTPEKKAFYRKQRKARLRAGDRFTPKQVFERDRYLCRICGGAVKAGATVPDHDAPTLDHRVPLTLGGSHTFDNVQCAHFICNVRKAWKLHPTPGVVSILGA